ncbi:MAG: PhnD/SsuA/transferrin family substrate-binding protein, partial [Patescibacteria group bacterium]|nr:PhnD/SsuA/transferrin family substrate-binding protein [Patescibacteria group bacterium]
WRSPDIYRFLVATSPQMSSSLRSAIETVLVTMHTTDEGRNVLSSFGDTTKFTAIENTEATYGIISNLSSVVESEIVSQ